MYTVSRPGTADHLLPEQCKQTVLEREAGNYDSCALRISRSGDYRLY